MEATGIQRLQSLTEYCQVQRWVWVKIGIPPIRRFKTKMHSVSDPFLLVNLPYLVVFGWMFVGHYFKKHCCSDTHSAFCGWNPFFGKLHMLILCLFTFFSAEFHLCINHFFYWNQFSLVNIFNLPFSWLGEQPQFTRVTTKLGKQPAHKFSFSFFNLRFNFSFLGPEPHRLESDSYTPGNPQVDDISR